MQSIQDTLIFEASSVAVDGDMAGKGMELVEKLQIHYPTWFFIYLFTLLVFFAWIRMYYGNIFTQTVQATANFKVASRMYKDHSQLQNQLDGSLYVLYFLSMAFLLYIVEIKLDLIPYNLNEGLHYLFNLALLVGVFMGRVLLFNLSGFLFNSVDILREYLYNTFIFNKIMGMATLPLLLFMVYTRGLGQELIFWTTMTVVVMIIIMRLIRGVVFYFRKEVFVFYMFLYLCALEIVPLVLLYRWLEGIL